MFKKTEITDESDCVDDGTQNITVYNTAPWKRSKRTLLHLAPEGRHVYSNRTTKFPKAPEGRCVLSLQRSDMSVAEKIYHSRTPEECNGYGETLRPF